jgi:predicted enzyme related to lactoylglutathione lyase
MGCVVALVLLPIVVIGGLVLGTALSHDDSSGEKSHTLDSGVIDDIAWRVDAERDVQGDSCIFLYEGDELTTGACEPVPQHATIGGRTIVFGMADGDEASVRVELDGGEVVEIATQTVDGIDGHFYVQEVDGEVDAVTVAP